MKARRLRQLIGIKEAELYALEELLRLQPHDACALAVMRPDLWGERLAQLVLLSDYACQLPESFAALIRDAGVPPNRRKHFVLTTCSKDRGPAHRGGGMYFDPQNGAIVTAAPAIISRLYSVCRITTALDHPESALLAALWLASWPSSRRRTLWRRLCHLPCHTRLQCCPPNPRHDGWVSANNVVLTSCQPAGFRA